MTQKKIITEYDVEKAVDFLRDNAIAIGKAKERLVKAANMLKHIEALEFMKAEGSNDVRRYSSRTAETYKEGIIEEAQAAGEFEKLKALREAASMVIETWRSEQATFRAMRI